MSRYFNSFMDDSSEALEHSWGTSPKAKAREKEYNHWYYQKHKDEIAAIRKQRRAATNSYKQAEKSDNDARRYEALLGGTNARLLGYHISNVYKDPNGDYRGKVTIADSRHLNPSAVNRLHNAKYKYERMLKESESKSRELRRQGDYQMGFAKSEARRIIQDMKNPSAKELVEFYLDTTVAKVKKSVKKAKKYATKAMSTAEKYTTKAVSNAEKAAKKYVTKAMPMAEKTAKKAKKYATEAMSTAEKAANKAKRYATKTIKSVVR